MTISFDVALAVYRAAVAACDPCARVTEALAGERGLGAGDLVGIAAGKAALAMARGAGPVARGIAVTLDGDTRGLPPGWQSVRAAHPEPDERSLAAGAAARALVDGATATDLVLALISGGASAMLEQPRLALVDLRVTMRALMAAGAPIAELNTVRGALSAIKAGQLVERCPARVLTLVASDVIGDSLEVVGSGPTVGPWLANAGAPVDVGAAAEARRIAAIAILARYGIASPDALAMPISSRIVTRRDHAEVVLPMSAFVDAACAALRGHHVVARRLDPPFGGDVAEVADHLAAQRGPVVGWGEATVRVGPGHGEGGRAQQLALELARRIRGTDRTAFIAGSDGIDGPPPRDRSPAAGGFVDGSTWERIRAAGIDPDAALARCDAGGALAAVDARIVTGTTGVNHADIAILG